MPRSGEKYQLAEKVVTVLRCHAVYCLVKAQSSQGAYRFWVNKSLLTNPIAPAGNPREKAAL